MNRSIVTTDILDEKLDLEFASNFTGFIGLVDSYSKSKRTAKVQPLGKIKTTKGFVNLPVVNLPVATHCAGGIEIIPDYQKGDLVYCAPNLVPTYNQLKGQYEIDYSRKNKLENLIVAYGLKKQPSVVNPLVQKDGLVITNNSDMYAQFASDKIEFKIGVKPVEKSVLGETLKDKIDTLCTKMESLVDAINALTVTCPPLGGVSTTPINSGTFSTIKSDIGSLKSELSEILSDNFKNN